MNPIDLKQFAEHSQKLPKTWLAPVKKESDFKLWKMFCAHYIDFSSAFTVTLMTSAFFNLSLKSLLVTKGMQKAWSETVVWTFTASILPLMVFSYFFFSYLMNHGQTYGMHLLKKRIDMKSLHYKEAALWACSSMVLCFTGGLSYFIQKEKWQNFKAQDYLYGDLMVERALSPVNLLSEIDKISVEEEVVEENWSQAA